MELSNQLIFVVGLLFLLSILATAITPRLGVPLLLVFLVVGMLAGVDGPGGIEFSDYSLANLAGITGLAVILFDGGMRTSMKNFRLAMGPALSLASVGVVITAAIAGAFAAPLLGLELAEGLLIGAIVGSTDAAAVFALLHTSAVSLNPRVTSALEIESGTNDPMAIFLTLALLQYLIAPAEYALIQSLWLLLQQMGLGVAAGIGGGLLLAAGLKRIQLTDSLYPLFVLSGALSLFGLTAVIGGSGFVAVYVAGLIIGNRSVRGLANIRRFHDGAAWLAQIGMFVILGLLVTPSELVKVALPALMIALVLTLVARPVAVWVSLLPFRFPVAEKIYISWVGLRGSVPIVLATFPWLAGVENAALFFNVAFFIVLVSLLIQGWTIAPAARLLGLHVPVDTARVQRIDIDLPGAHDYEIVSYRVGRNTTAAGQTVKQLALPETSRVICLAREGSVLPYRDWGTLRTGDHISLLARQSELASLDRIFESHRKPPRKAEQRYFGEFGVDPQAPLQSLTEAYGLELPEGGADKTIAEYLSATLPGPVVGDRLRLGEMELVIRAMEDGHIRGVGLRLPH